MQLISSSSLPFIIIIIIIVAICGRPQWLSGAHIYKDAARTMMPRRDSLGPPAIRAVSITKIIRSRSPLPPRNNNTHNDNNIIACTSPPLTATDDIALLRVRHRARRTQYMPCKLHRCTMHHAAGVYCNRQIGLHLLFLSDGVTELWIYGGLKTHHGQVKCDFLKIIQFISSYRERYPK